MNPAIRICVGIVVLWSFAGVARGDERSRQRAFFGDFGATVFSFADPDARNVAVELLREHPDLGERARLARDPVAVRALFAEAVSWPLTLQMRERYAQHNTTDKDLRNDLALGESLRSQNLDLVETLAVASRTFQDKTKLPRERAIAWCWLLHSTAWIHDPSRISLREATKGDLGFPSKSLLDRRMHQLRRSWGSAFRHIARRFARMNQGGLSSEKSVQANTHWRSKSDDSYFLPKVWVLEATRCGSHYAFTGEAMAYLQSPATKRAQPFVPSERYAEHQARVAKEFYLRAAYRASYFPRIHWVPPEREPTPVSDELEELFRD